MKSSALAAPFNLSVKGRQRAGRRRRDEPRRQAEEGRHDQDDRRRPAGSLRGRDVGQAPGLHDDGHGSRDVRKHGQRTEHLGAARQAGVRGHAGVRDEEEPGQGQHYGVVGIRRERTGNASTVSSQVSAGALPRTPGSSTPMHTRSPLYRRGWIVADAGANALFRVDSKGHIRTLSVLPPQGR